MGRYGFRSACSWIILPLLASGLLVLGHVCESLEEPRSSALAFEDVVFESGDVIFRRGTGLVSRAVLSVDARSRFSHIGIIHLVAGEPLVIHASPGTSLADPTKIMIEPMADFFAADQTLAAALYRPRKDYREAGEQAAAIAYGYVLEERLFDVAFSLETAEALYCTELVWRSYLEAGLDLVGGKLDQLSIPLYQEKCLLPSSLEMSPYLYHVHNFGSKGRLE